MKRTRVTIDALVTDGGQVGAPLVRALREALALRLRAAPAAAESRRVDTVGVRVAHGADATRIAGGIADAVARTARGGRQGK